MPNKGVVTRTNGKPLLMLARGYNIETTQGMHSSVPVKADEVIYSGMVMHKEWNSSLNRYEWVKGGPATWNSASTGTELFYALDDYNKEDVLAADSLIGLPCSGNYIFQTPYFTGTAANFTDGLFVTYDGTTGSIKLITAFETANEPIIGKVENINGAFDVSPWDVSGGLADQDVVVIKTLFLPNLADAT